MQLTRKLALAGLAVLCAVQGGLVLAERPAGAVMQSCERVFSPIVAGSAGRSAEGGNIPKDADYRVIADTYGPYSENLRLRLVNADTQHEFYGVVLSHGGANVWWNHAHGTQHNGTGENLFVYFRAVDFYGGPLPAGFTVVPRLQVDLPDGTCDQFGMDALGPRNGDVDSNGNAGDPVNSATGNFFYKPQVSTEASLLVPSYNSMDVWFAPNSTSGKYGVFGTDWTSELDVQLANVPNSTDLYFRQRTGTVTRFTSASTDVWTSPGQLQANTLTRNSTTGEYTLTYKSGAKVYFDSSKRMTAMDTPFGARVEIARGFGSNPSLTLVRSKFDGNYAQAWAVYDDKKWDESSGLDGLVDRVVGPYDAAAGGTPPNGTPVVKATYDESLRLVGLSVPYGLGSSAVGGEKYTYMPDVATGLPSTQIKEVSQKTSSTNSRVLITNEYERGTGRISKQTTGIGEENLFSYSATGGKVNTSVVHRNGIGTAATTTETLTYKHDPAGRIAGVGGSGGTDGATVASSSATWSQELPTDLRTPREAKTGATYEAGNPTGVYPPDPLATNTASTTGATAAYCSTTGDPRVRQTTDLAGITTKYWWTTDSDQTVCDGTRAVPVKVQHVAGVSGKEWWTAYTVEPTAPSLVKQVTESPTGDNVTTAYTWDINRRLMLTKTTYPNGPSSAEVTFYTYDAAGRLLGQRDPTGAETWWVHDAMGRVVKQVGPVDMSTRPGCTATACTLGTTPPTSPTTTQEWAYNVDGTLKTYTNQVGGITNYTTSFSTTGRVETVKEPKRLIDNGAEIRTVTTSSYDSFGRLTEVQEKGEAASGTAPAAYTTTSTTSYTYGLFGRLKTKATSVDATASHDLVESYAYDADGNLTVTARGSNPNTAANQVQTAEYDLRGRLTKQWGATGDTSAPDGITGGTGGGSAVREYREWQYDNANRVTAEIVGSGAEQQRTLRRYDTAGRLQYLVVDRDGDGTSWGTDGKPTDADDNVTEYTYTPAGRLATVIEPPTDATSYLWGSAPASQRTTTYGYDGAGRNKTITGSLYATPTGIEYTARGEVKQVTLPGGKVTKYEYNAAGQTTKVTNPAPQGASNTWVSSITKYDGRGLKISQTEPPADGGTAAAATWTYTADGLVATATDPLGDPALHPADTADHTVSYFYDGRGNRVVRRSQTKASSAAATSTTIDETWTYDRANRVTASKRPGEATGTTYAYDTLTGALTTKTLPSGRIETTAYWNNGQPKSLTTITGTDTATRTRSCYWHDSVNNQTVALEDSSPSSTSSVCAAGKATVQNWGHTGALNEIAYPDNPNTPATQDEKYSYTWDLQGRPRTVTYPDGTVHQFVHDKLGRLQASAIVWSGGGGFPIASYSYDANDNRTNETVNWSEGSRTWTYPANGAPYPSKYVQQMTTGGNRTTDLTWTDSGRVKTETTSGATRTYTYDDAGQLLGRAEPGGTSYAYTYGPRGLRLSSTVGSTTTQNTYNDLGQLKTSKVGSTTTGTYDYDADGRRTSATTPSAATTTSYDSRGLIKSITTDNTTGSDYLENRTYDVNRRLTTESFQVGSATPSTWSYTWDPTRPKAVPLEIRFDNNVWSRSNYGLEFVGIHFSSSGNASYFAFDHQRSVIPNSANTAAPTDYDPYGTPTSIQGVQFAYRSEVMNVALIHLRNRDYDPTTGTFTTTDPLDGISGTPTETNPYHYVDNDPANRTDPLGLSPDNCDIFGRSNIATRILADMCDHPQTTLRAVLAGAACGAGAAMLGLPAAAPYAASLCAGIVTRAGSVLEDGGSGPEAQAAALNPQALLTDLAIGAVLHVAGGPAPRVPTRTAAPGEGAASEAAGTLSPYQKGVLGNGWSTEAAAASGVKIVGNEVDLIFNINGQAVRVRADVLAQLPEGQYVYIESKFSPKASYTSNQQIVIPELVKAGDAGLPATVGSRSGLLQAGDRIRVVFQGDVWNGGPTLYGG
jgi:RHS repeat-associated protein